MKLCLPSWIFKWRFACVAAALFRLASTPAHGQAMTGSFTDEPLRATISAKDNGDIRSYELTSNQELRDHLPADGRVSFSESRDHARVRTGNVMFDGLYALAVSEALQNSVPEIKDHAYGNGKPVRLDAFQTGEFWTYV